MKFVPQLFGFEAAFQRRHDVIAWRHHCSNAKGNAKGNTSVRIFIASCWFWCRLTRTVRTFSVYQHSHVLYCNTAMESVVSTLWHACTDVISRPGRGLRAVFGSFGFGLYSWGLVLCQDRGFINIKCCRFVVARCSLILTFYRILQWDIYDWLYTSCFVCVVSRIRDEIFLFSFTVCFGLGLGLNTEH